MYPMFLTFHYILYLTALGVWLLFLLLHNQLPHLETNEVQLNLTSVERWPSSRLTAGKKWGGRCIGPRRFCVSYFHEATSKVSSLNCVDLVTSWVACNGPATLPTIHTHSIAFPLYHKPTLSSSLAQLSLPAACTFIISGVGVLTSHWLSLSASLLLLFFFAFLLNHQL